MKFDFMCKIKKPTMDFSLSSLKEDKTKVDLKGEENMGLSSMKLNFKDLLKKDKSEEKSESTVSKLGLNNIKVSSILGKDKQ